MRLTLSTDTAALPTLDWNAAVGRRRAYFGSTLANLRALGSAAGDLAGFEAGGRFVVLVTDPALVRDVLVTRADDYGMMSPTVSPPAVMPMFQSDGEDHQRRRRLVTPAFRPRHFHAYAEAIRACTERQADGWRDGQTIQIGAEMERLAFDIASRTLLSREGRADAALLAAAERTMARAGDLKWSPAHLPAFWQVSRRMKMVSAHTALTEAVRGLLKERREAPTDGLDMVSVLLQADPGEDEDAELTAQILGVLYAGTVNFALSLAWACTQMARQPNIAAQVAEEASALSGPPTLDDLPRLGYTRQVYQESLRDMRRTSSIQRWSLRETTLGGCRVPAGALVCIFPYLLHHDGRVFPNPERFQPERFAPGWEDTPMRQSFLPFGDGAHVCVGNHFTLMNAQIILAVLAQRVRLECPAGQTLGSEALSSLRPRHDAPLRVSATS